MAGLAVLRDNSESDDCDAGFEFDGNFQNADVGRPFDTIPVQVCDIRFVFVGDEQQSIRRTYHNVIVALIRVERRIQLSRSYGQAAQEDIAE